MAEERTRFDVAELKVRAEQADAQIIVGNQPEIYGDRVAVEQILSNLIENAIKYNHPDRPRLYVSPGVGLAIPPNSAYRTMGAASTRATDRVFDLFRRSGTQDRPGEGIGLAHVRAVVYRLGGSILLNQVGVAPPSPFDTPALFRSRVRFHEQSIACDDYHDRGRSGPRAPDRKEHPACRDFEPHHPF
jgi:signal transduction histidine kinase